MSSRNIEDIKRYIRFMCDLLSDEDDDIKVRMSMISIYTKSILQSKIDDNIISNIINDLCKEIQGGKDNVSAILS